MNHDRVTKQERSQIEPVALLMAEGLPRNQVPPEPPPAQW